MESAARELTVTLPATRQAVSGVLSTTLALQWKGMGLTGQRASAGSQAEQTAPAKLRRRPLGPQEEGLGDVCRQRRLLAAPAQAYLFLQAYHQPTTDAFDLWVWKLVHDKPV